MDSVKAPARIAEDDQFRSNHVRELVQGADPQHVAIGHCSIPRVIIQFWHDLAGIPEDVRECLDSWEPLTQQGFKRVLFDDHMARQFISTQFGARYIRAFDRCRHPAMRCDYFRLCFITAHGGFYVDADEVYRGGDCQFLFLDSRLKVQPLCYDNSSGRMVENAEFIGSRASLPEWTFYVNNNPLIAPASHAVIRLALDRSTRILLSGAWEQLGIQSTTGPGNLTASLVRHSVASLYAGKHRDFLLLTNWDAISISRWPLSYREDERNWRLWNPIA